MVEIIRPKVLFVAWHPYEVSWVHRDIEILRREFTVKVARFATFVDVLNVICQIKEVDVSFVWFGGKAAAITVFLSKLLRKKSIVIAAGADAARVPDIGYGMSLNPINRFFVQFSFQYADAVLAVSESTRIELLKNYHVNPEKVRVVYHGFDYEKYKPKGKKENLVLTVGGISWGTLVKKGLETFIKATNYLNDVNFMLIGAYEDDSILYLKSIAGSNVKFTGFIPFPDLLGFMQKAKVYVQVSAHESFGCSLAEAMLCECVPVVTKRAALPEVVGDTGYYVPVDDPKQTARIIEEALFSEKGSLARKRIIQKFSLQRREKELMMIIKNLLKKQDVFWRILGY